MTAAHDKLQDIYTRWFDKTNKIFEEHKEQKWHAVASGSGMHHKWVLGAYWGKIAASRKLRNFEEVSQDLQRGCRVGKVQHGQHNMESED